GGPTFDSRIKPESPDPFTPSAGKIPTFNLPGGPGVHGDPYVYPGYRVPPFYDSMIAKVVVHARTRELAIARMRRALDAMVVEGIQTTIPLHLRIMNSPAFQAGDISTRILEEMLSSNGAREAQTSAPALTTASA